MTLEIEILNPKVMKILKALEDMELISIRKPQPKHHKISKKLSLAELLLTGPVGTKKQVKKIEKNRKGITAWKKKGKK